MSVTTGYTKPYTANQEVMRHRQIIEKENSIRKMQEARLHIKSPLHFCTSDQLAQARSVYGVRLNPIPPPLRPYDRIMQLPPDWDPKVKNDQYRNLKKYMVNARMDEDNREIPVLFNSETGHRLLSPPETFKRDHVRIKTFHNSIYRTNGIMTMDRKKGY